MRYAFLFLALSALFAENIADIEKNINANKAKLQEKTKQQQQITNKLSELGNTINSRRNQITKLQTQIDLLQKNIRQNQGQNQIQGKKLQDLQHKFSILESQKNKIQFYIANLIVNDLAFSLVLDKQNGISPDDVILEDIFDILSQQSQKKILVLNDQQLQIAKQMDQTTTAISEISLLINTQENKKQQLQKMINTQKVLNKKLQEEMNAYNQKIAQIAKEREGLNAILQDLNIIKANKQKELQAAQKKARLEAQKAQKQAQQQTTQQQQDKSKAQAKLDIVQMANSYKNVSVIKYDGKKTISPLDNYTIEQNFGPYYDPVYNLKVFNESVTLVSKTPNAVVYSIMDGKVVYAKEAPILKKVVIIEHPNEMYSIYSQLDKIAPTVKPGFMVKKGYTIGRVSQRLGLEITQKDMHINPLDVIAKSK